MIVSPVIRDTFRQNGLGSRVISEDIQAILPKGIELVWNDDTLKWEVYQVVKKGGTHSGDELRWQMTFPFREVTPGAVRNTLQKYDTTKGGTKDKEDLEREWGFTFQRVMENSRRRRTKLFEETRREIASVSKFLGRMVENQKQCVVPAGPPVGRSPSGALVRPYEKSKL